MNKKQFTATAMYSQGSYTSPAVKVVEIHAEGVLCVSVRSLEVWENADPFEWD